MGQTTKIEWCDHTFNPWIGCEKVSPGCDHCYAERNFGLRLGKATWGSSGTRLITGEDYWKQPYRWAVAIAKNVARGREVRRRRVFCGSLCDVFEDRPDLVRPRARLFDLIDRTPDLDWLLLTKRPENISRLMPPLVTQYIPEAGQMSYQEGVRENVWLGATVESDAQHQRIWDLLKTPAAARFISYEPAIGPLDLDKWEAVCKDWLQVATIGTYLDWVIAGGETGPGARPAHPDWFRTIRDQCAASGVPFFLKQLGEWGQSPNVDLERARASGKKIAPNAPGYVMSRVGKKAAGCLLDGREHKEFPCLGPRASSLPLTPNP